MQIILINVALSVYEPLSHRNRFTDVKQSWLSNLVSFWPRTTLYKGAINLVKYDLLRFWIQNLQRLG